MSMKEEIFDHMRTALGIDDAETLQSLYENFQEMANGSVQEIADAVTARDFGALRLAAHTLKGCAANVGAEEIRTQSYAIELAAKASTLTGTAEALAAIRSLVGKL